MAFEPPPHWTEEMEAKMRPEPDKLVSWLPTTLLFLACAAVFALLLAYGGAWERLQKALGPFVWR